MLASTAAEHIGVSASAIPDGPGSSSPTWRGLGLSARRVGAYVARELGNRDGRCEQNERSKGQHRPCNMRVLPLIPEREPVRRAGLAPLEPKPKKSISSSVQLQI